MVVQTEGCLLNNCSDSNISANIKNIMCCNGKWGGCVCNKISAVLLFVGGINWGLVGIGMLMGNDGWNVVKMLLGSWPTVEAVVYLLVGVAAVMKLFGCRCSKCKAACASCSVSESTDNQM